MGQGSGFWVSGLGFTNLPTPTSRNPHRELGFAAESAELLLAGSVAADEAFCVTVKNPAGAQEIAHVLAALSVDSSNATPGASAATLFLQVAHPPLREGCRSQLCTELSAVRVSRACAVRLSQTLTFHDIPQHSDITRGTFIQLATEALPHFPPRPPPPPPHHITLPLPGQRLLCWGSCFMGCTNLCWMQGLGFRV